MDTFNKYSYSDKRPRITRGFHRPFFMMDIEKKKVIKRK
ncbi:hypothetical protein M23134_04422 [Microscilla marina ATCC 23134]|uniref:Uncharacterized protein n=1 Tax=Microscilla marina ATCC 23134 TaxID=313606 RepID=A1ZM43_MICM2|nr:hypothetical protein M23134_04422 [Microscilla marina ATCC 23134]